MEHEDTAFHRPIDLASHRTARATRRIRAGRIPSEFMPLDYAADPAVHQGIEGPGVPWGALVSIAAFCIAILVCAAYGVHCFFAH
ncbi:hypothetical protein [Variovorax sp. N23]|uniref:hypothetical protein n=1 Tax=Variovorax sp. N23 TaxID=2980555 RepID=UPI0021CA9B32|nr:hypothetical protein [Variovorax sp. N23]MCU4119349.1 hypothetical protein [Variovorax sp. N23]